MEVENNIIDDRFSKLSISPTHWQYPDLDLSTAEEIVKDFTITTITEVRYVTVEVEECHFFKNEKENKAKEAISSAMTIFYSIDLAESSELIHYYCNMPKKYTKLSAEELVLWGEARGLTDLPDVETLAFSLQNEYCGDIKVANLIQKYLLQFNWVRLEEDPNTGKYVEINEDNL